MQFANAARDSSDNARRRCGEPFYFRDRHAGANGLSTKRSTKGCRVDGMSDAVAPTQVRCSPHIAIAVICTLAAACSTVGSRPPQVPAAAASSKGRPSGDVVLFVRDATERSTTLASMLCERLVAAGVPCRILRTATQAAAPWAADAQAAHDSGATFAVRVTVVQRHDVVDRLHQEDWDSHEATGLVGRRETVDVGPTTNADDLRLDVIASLRRSADAFLVNRWIDSGGVLDVNGSPNQANRRWEEVYAAMAARLSRQVVAALPWTGIH